MTRTLIVLGCAGLLALGLAIGSFAGITNGGDGDGIPDNDDNCLLVPNGPLGGACSNQEDGITAQNPDDPGPAGSLTGFVVEGDAPTASDDVQRCHKIGTVTPNETRANPRAITTFHRRHPGHRSGRAVDCGGRLRGAGDFDKQADRGDDDDHTSVE